MKRNLIVLPDGTKLYSGTGTQDAIQSVTVTESVNSGTELTSGSVCCSCLEATIINPGGGLLLNAGDVVQLYRFETDKDLQSLDRCEKVGTFLLEKPVRPTANTLKITAYDYISLLDKDLSDWLLSLDGWPYAVTDFAKMVCGVCGLQANEDTIEALPNGSHPIQKFAVSVTGRKLMEWVGQIGGRFCRADKDGYMEFAWYEPTNISIGSGDSYYMGGSLSYEDYTVSPIEKVQIRLTEDDVGVVAPDGDTTEKNTYIITGNYLLSDSSTAAIQPIAQSLYNQLSTVIYTPLKVTIPLAVGIRAGQIIQVIDRNGKELPTYVMTAVQTGQRIELESTGSHRRDSTTAVNNESLRDLRGRVLTIQKSAEALRIENKELEGRCSALEMQVGSITMEVVNDKNGAAASIKISAGEKILVDSSSPRKAFANSAESAVEITGGTVAFNSNTLIVNSTNFTVDASGKITAKDAVLSGSMTTINGYRSARLTSGGLELTYDNAHKATFHTTTWKDKPEVIGTGIYISEDSDFIVFGRSNGSGTYNVAYTISYGIGLDSYADRHVFDGSARFHGPVTFDSAVTHSGEVTFDGSIYLANSKYIYGYDTEGNYRSLVTVNSSNQACFGGYALDTYLYGANLYVGHGGYPTIIRGSSITVNNAATFVSDVTFKTGVSGISAVFSSSVVAGWVKSNRIAMTDSDGNVQYYAYLSSDTFYVGEANHMTYLFGSQVEVRNLIDPTLAHHAVPKSYVDGKFLGRMRLLTADDDCNDIIEDGVYWYSTSSVPANAPFANAAIIEVYGADNTTSQKIQRAARYGAGGYSATRALYGGSWCEWYHYALTTNGVIPVSMGGTGGTTIAEAQSALHVTQGYMYSQLSSGNLSNSGIDAYPTRAGVFRVTTGSANMGIPGNYGCLVIFNGGGYYMHLYVNSSGFWVARTDGLTAPTWKKMAVAS